MTGSTLPLRIARGKVDGLEGRFRVMAPWWDAKGMPRRGCRAEPARRAGQEFGERLAGAGAKLSVSAPL